MFFFAQTDQIPLQQPFHCEIEHKLGMTCLTTGPVTCRVRLDRFFNHNITNGILVIYIYCPSMHRIFIKNNNHCSSEAATFLGRRSTSGQQLTTRFKFFFGGNLFLQTLRYFYWQVLSPKEGIFVLN